MMKYNIETLWLQVHLPRRKLILLGCCYQPPNANCEYLDTFCEMLDNNTAVGQDTYLWVILTLTGFAQKNRD